MTAGLQRPLAIVGLPVIGVLALLQLFDPGTVAGLPASTVVGTAMTTVVAWGTVVALVYGARWRSIGFAVLTTVFAVQTLSGWAIQNRVAIYSVVGVAALFIVIGGQHDGSDPASSSHTGR